MQRSISVAALQKNEHFPAVKLLASVLSAAYSVSHAASRIIYQVVRHKRLVGPPASTGDAGSG